MHHVMENASLIDVDWLPFEEEFYALNLANNSAQVVICGAGIASNGFLIFVIAKHRSVSAHHLMEICALFFCWAFFAIGSL